MSEETKKRFKGRLRPVGAGIPSVAIEVLDLETGIKTVYSSIGETARALDVAQSSISYYFSPKYKLKPNSKSARRFVKEDINSQKFFCSATGLPL